jgi:DNA-binding LacI/PurR family transcriptional regulator
MSDVARLAGVSHQTVSRVINGADGIRPQTRDRVLAAVAELGYRRNNAARLLASSRSGLIGVVRWGSGLFGPANVIVGIEEVADERGYRLSISDVREFTGQAIRQAVELQLESAVEALIVVVPHRGALRDIENGGLGVPVVVAMGGGQTERPFTVSLDNRAGARAATRHLLDLGHQTVTHLAGPQDWEEASARCEGWRAELEAAGRTVPALRWGDWSAESGYETGRSLARELDVTAIFAANDQMALGLIRALSEQGRRVPEDVSVVGFDDLPEAPYFAPPLTTVRQEFRLLGHRIMDMVERALAGEDDPRTDLVEPELVVRSSTAPPPS